MSDNVQAFFYGVGFGFIGLVTDILYFGSKKEILWGFLGMLLNGAILLMVGLIGLGWNGH